MIFLSYKILANKKETCYSMAILTDDRSEGEMMMSKETIKEQAMRLFAEHGYEGASMQLVAEAVGIKKQSIYTHYRNKDELFMAAFEQAIQNERAAAVETIQAMTSLAELEGYLYTTAKRYEERIAMRFWLRMSFYPPLHLEKRVMTYVYDYLDTVEAALYALFTRQQHEVVEALDAQMMARAYLSVIDACHIELLYGGSVRAAARIEATWAIFKRGVQR